MVEIQNKKPRYWYDVSGGSVGSWIDGGIQTKCMEDADIVLLPGGGDWNPMLYRQPVGRSTHFHNPTDLHQLNQLIRGLILGKKIVGICRGAQGMCIAEGGKLIQHVTNHQGSHMMIPTSSADSDKIVITNSLHHQMLNLQSIPTPGRWDLLYYSLGLSTMYLDGENYNQFEEVLRKGNKIKEPEIVLFPYMPGLAIQGHPEMSGMGSDLIEVSNRMLVDKLLGSKVVPNNFGVISRLRRLVTQLEKTIDSSLKSETTTLNQITSRVRPQTDIFALPAVAEKTQTQIKKDEKDWSSSIRYIGSGK